MEKSQHKSGKQTRSLTVSMRAIVVPCLFSHPACDAEYFYGGSGVKERTFVVQRRNMRGRGKGGRGHEVEGRKQTLICLIKWFSSFL